MKPFTILLAAALLTALPHRASAETVALSQDQAVAKAVARHPVIRAAQANAQAATARVREAKTGWLPRVRIEGGYQYMGPQQRLTMSIQPDFLPDPIVINNDIGSVHNASIGVTVLWRAYDFGARDVSTQAARALAAAARAEAKERSVDIAYAVRASYLAALFFHEMERVTQRSLQVAASEQHEEQVKRKAGVGSDLDLARADTRVAQLEARLTQARQERRRALTTLRLLLGLPAGTTLRLTDSLSSLGTGAVQTSVSPARHPTRLKLEALRHASELQLKQQWRSYWPTLDVMGSLKYQYPKNYFENDKAGLFYTAGVLLTWNVFDGDLLRRQRAETRSRIRQVESLERANDEEVTRQVADAQAQLRTAAAAAASAQRLRSAAAVYYQAAVVSKKAGTGTALEVRKAEETLDQAELSEVKAWFDGAMARAAWLRALGRIARKENP